MDEDNEDRPVHHRRRTQSAARNYPRRSNNNIPGNIQLNHVPIPDLRQGMGNMWLDRQNRNTLNMRRDMNNVRPINYPRRERNTIRRDMSNVRDTHLMRQYMGNMGPDTTNVRRDPNYFRDHTRTQRRDNGNTSNIRENTSNMRQNNRYNKAKHIGFRSLEEISQSNVQDIIVKVNEKRDAFMNIIGTQIDRNDIYVLVIAIISKICQSSFNELKLQLLLDICRSQFMISLRNYLTDLPYMGDKAKNSLYWNNQTEFWVNFIVFCDCITNSSPTTALKTCRALIESVSKSCLEGLKQRHEFDLPEEHVVKLVEINEKLTTFEKRTEIINTQNLMEYNEDQRQPPENFRELTVLPGREDLLEQKPFLRPNIINGGYQDVEHYLDVQFRLLREDCFGPLRDGILQYMENPNKHRYDNVRILHGVKFFKPYVSQSRVGSVVQINLKHKSNRNFKRVNWAHSKRFIFGSLVLFTKDNCKNFIVATILDRDLKLLADGQIPVSVVDESFSGELYNANNTYTMIESEVYFEPYFHVLKALQDPTFPEHLAMQQYIVKVEAAIRAPSYLDINTIYTLDNTPETDCHKELPDKREDFNDMSALLENKYDIEDETIQKDEIIRFNVLRSDTWPTRDELGFNESQFQAYKLALTQEFAVIQGPPGTGKTFLGINVAKTLLNNHSNQNECLLLVICYTNHALDQFLEAILKFTHSIVRIGGQSRSETMKKININNLRRLGQYSADKMYLEQKHALRNLISDFQKALMHFDVLNNGVINTHCMSNIDQIQFLKHFYLRQYGGLNEDLLKLWLFETSHDYYEDIDTCLEEDIPIQDAYEEIRKRTDMVLDEDDDLINDKDPELEITASFSLTDAKAKLKVLIANYKKSEEPKELEALGYQIIALKAKINMFNDMSPLRSNQPRTLVNGRTDFSAIPSAERWILYFSWVHDRIEEVRNQVIALQGQVTNHVTAFEEARMVADMQIVRKKKVVGMTTSGAARLRKLLQTVAPPIVIVEEAAEVLEQHIVTSLTQNCKHLILIGDHQQLRPSASHMKLARHYQIEVSLFERMIKNGMHSRRLGVQHRMRPEIAALISPHIYPDLENHHSVEMFPDVLGMKNNLFFYTHNFEEQEINDSSSRSNFKEADMTLGLANYLMQQGYSSEEVTILAAYSGQMFYMRKERSKYPHLANMKITVVDNYQGEESKIILLSLVRNNALGKIGFLGTENRICVALSRAREGFYMFGNIDILKNNSDLWKKIATTLEEKDSLGTTLSLRCQNHPDQTTVISSLQDFEKVPEGGCLLVCNSNLPRCNHKCSLFCHGYDREHLTNITKCPVNCEKILCDLGHVCPLKCSDECQPCTQMVLKMLPCGHEMSVYCHLEPDDPKIKCQTIVEAALPHCGHKTQKACSADVKDLRCKERCVYRLENCGHACVRSCHVTNDPHHEKYQCRKPCPRQRLGCTANLEGNFGDHQCMKLCHEVCDNCTVMVTKKRAECKHSVQIACNKDPDLKPCQKKCARSLPCEHFCQKKCSEPCGDCKVMVKKAIPECNHNINVFCSHPATKENCTHKCNKTLSCGHPCKDLCKNQCDATRCTELSSYEHLSPCGHSVKVPCNIVGAIKSGAMDTKVLTRLCQSKCGIELACGHQCAGTCGKCLSGRIHIPCTQPCNKPNICGHLCEEPCNQICPPCNKRCFVKCQHSQCNKICGDPCKQCQEKCNRKCPHGRCNLRCGQPCDRKPCDEPCPLTLACQHRCRGLCGEPCPDICNICRPDDFPRDFLGDPFEEDDKFVLLQDCGHVMEVNDMDNMMTGDRETIQIRTCPFCRTPIINTNRYKDSVNNTFKTEINPIKKRIFGDVKAIKLKKDKLQADINDFLSRTKVLSHLHDQWHLVFRNLLAILRFKKKLSMLEVDMCAIYYGIFEMIAECYMKYEKSGASELEDSIDEQITLLCETMPIKRKTHIVPKISQQQQKDIGNEINRMNAIVEFSKILSSVSYKTAKNNNLVIKAKEDAKTVVFSYAVYNDDKCIIALKKLQEVAKVSGTVTKLERELVAKAIGLSAGHWFKCPNGHFYCIGECGGAMETSKCIECGAAIGGSRHTLLTSNAHAPEMDGSRFPKWSEQYNNMGNFMLDE